MNKFWCNLPGSGERTGPVLGAGLRIQVGTTQTAGVAAGDFVGVAAMSVGVSAAPEDRVRPSWAVLLKESALPLPPPADSVGTSAVPEHRGSSTAIKQIFISFNG